MKRIKIVLIFIICVLIQMQIAKRFSIFRTAPLQLILIAVIYYCFKRDWYGGLLIGISAGIILDLHSGGRLGIFALTYGAMGAVAGSFQGYVFKDFLLPKLIVVLFATVFVQILNLHLIRIFQPTFSFTLCIYRSILAGALLNSIVAAPLYIIAGRNDRRIRIRR